MSNAPNISAPSDPWERLLETIRGQADLPPAEPYTPTQGDPLDRLIRRMRGEDVDALESTGAAPSNVAGEPPCGTADIAQVTWSGAAKPGQAQPSAPAAGVEAQLGREVFEMLRAANLPGPARAAAANLLCEQLHWLESSPGVAPSAAEMANGLRKVLSILVTTQFE